jgi:predicted  nucleic acid-binding Zn-ribbon protein
MPRLPKLFRYQEIQTRLQALERLKVQLERDPNLLQWEERFRESQSLHARSAGELKQRRGSLRRLESELGSCQERLRSEEAKLYGGRVTSSRELEQIQQKALEYSKQRAALEEQILGIMEDEERLGAELESLTRVMAGIEKEIAALRGELSRQQLEITMEEADLKEEAAGLSGELPADWLEKFHRLAKSKQGTAIARVKSNSCGACHISLSESLLQQVKRGEDVLLFCESCGRILFF